MSDVLASIQRGVQRQRSASSEMTKRSCEELIAKVQKKPILWMTSDPQFKNRTLKADVWWELAEQLGMEVEALKKKWKHLKDQYRKELKKTTDPKMSDADGEWKSFWRYFDKLDFLRHEMLPASSSCNSDSVKIEIHENSINEDSIEADIEKYNYVTSTASIQSSAPSTSRTASKNKSNVRESMYDSEQKRIKLTDKPIDQNNEEKDLMNDADYMFLRSILPSMKKLSEYQKLKFRGKINDWLLEELSPS